MAFRSVLLAGSAAALAAACAGPHPLSRFSLLKPEHARALRERGEATPSVSLTASPPILTAAKGGPDPEPGAYVNVTFSVTAGSAPSSGALVAVYNAADDPSATAPMAWFDASGQTSGSFLFAPPRNRAPLVFR
jgi:acid phosphatase type 7